jgi:endonuclease/exonuclease/phosphatase family metal-dependent hydrolase
LILIAISGCAHDSATEGKFVKPGPEPEPDPVQNPLPKPLSFRVGAFNLYNFGPARVEKPDAMTALVDIARRYDLLVLQEIRDQSGAATAELLSQINAAGEQQYALELSSRAGRYSRKEQYGFLYRLDRVNILDFYDYDDGLEPDHDKFSYEPAIAYVDMGGITFSVITLHADPKDVVVELNRLIPVYDDAVLRSGDEDAMIIGDLNADCGSLADRAEPFVKLYSDTRFRWLIGNDADTTVRASTDCAYDRIIITRTLDGVLLDDLTQVYDFTAALGLDEQAALEVSDHFPVETVLQQESGF